MGSGVAVMIMLTLSGKTDLRYDFSRPIDPMEKAWVDSVFDRLSEEERIGQLIMLRAHSDKDSAYEAELDSVIRKFKVGGLCFFQGTPERQAFLTNRYQESSAIPLLIAMDAEWGLGMRLSASAISFPKQLMLGAIRDNRLIYDMGKEIARQCRRLGVHLNFAPVADVNNNPANPVINERSFGEDRYNVASKCLNYAQGLQDGGVMACAKHFPGHGDTDLDSHFDLPVIPYDRKRLDSLELVPFRVLTQYGTGSVMVAHLNVPALDDRENRPTTLSRNTVYGLLRRELNYEGLVFTDGMEMHGVTKYFSSGQAEVEALRAGNDVLLLPLDPGATVSAIVSALQADSLNRREIEASVKRVLRAKYRLGLSKPQRIDLHGIRDQLNTRQALILKRELTAKAITLVRDNPGLAGFPNLQRHCFASVALGDTGRTIFQNTCGLYAPIRHFNTSKYLDSSEIAILVDTLKQCDVVLVSLHNMRSRAADGYGLTASQLEFIRQLNQVTTVVLTVFGNPYSLKSFDDVPVLVAAYNDDPITQEVAAQALFGASDILGALPVTASAAAAFGAGVQKRFTSPRLAYAFPEMVGMNSDSLALMEKVIQEMIASGAAPGCQVLVAKDNKIVWNKAYGHFTYDSIAPAVTLESIFDLASVTKVAATTVSIMKLAGERRIELDAPASDYIPQLKATNKSDLTVRELIVHQAGLQAWIPFYQGTLGGANGASPKIYRKIPEPGFSIPVADGLFMSDAWADSVWERVFHSELRGVKDYKYSDLGFYLSMRAVQNVSGMPLDRYVQETFYRPLGMSTTAYNPWSFGWASRCVPTEDDRYWRMGVIRGYVHDMGAAMLGGVSGHAGLFSNANDLVKLFQMLLNGGEYAGRRYLEADVVKQFTERHTGSARRGLGWDMKDLNAKPQDLNMSPLASERTFGHTGFTGVCVWVDPDKNLIFIFLSNRTYPSMNNNRLINGNYRPKIHSLVYRSINNMQKRS